MAITDPYATPDLYLSGIKSKGGSIGANVTDIQRDLIAISRYIDDKLHTYFGLDVAATIRYYDAPSSFNSRYAGEAVGWAESENPWKRLIGGNDLNIEPIASLAGLEVIQDTDRDYLYTDETALVQGTDFLMLPRNALTGPQPEPYTMIRRINSAWVPGGEIRVTAIHGWSAVPAGIEKLTIELAALLRIETPRATNRISELNGTTDMSKQCDYIIEGIARSFKKQPGFGVSR